MKFLGKKYQKDHEKNGLLKTNLNFFVQSLKNHSPPTTPIPRIRHKPKKKKNLSDTSLMPFYFYSPCKNKYYAQFTLPIFNTNFQYQFSIPIFNTNFQYKFSIPIFDTNFWYQFSIPIFNTNVQYHFSIPIINTNCQDQFLVPVCAVSIFSTNF